MKAFLLKMISLSVFMLLIEIVSHQKHWQLINNDKYKSGSCGYHVKQARVIKRKKKKETDKRDKNIKETDVHNLHIHFSLSFIWCCVKAHFLFCSF